MSETRPGASQASHDVTRGPSPGTPSAAGGKTPPDMPSLMLELARIRREVEGGSEPGRKASWRAWLLLALTLATLAWWLFGKTCG